MTYRCPITRSEVSVSLSVPKSGYVQGARYMDAYIAKYKGLVLEAGFNL
jgi:hypothetical protein